MKKNTWKIPLIISLVLIVAGLVCFANSCRLKDKVYQNYGISISDASIQEVFINDHDEATVLKDLKSAIKSSDEEDELMEETAPVEGAVEEGAEADADTANAVAEKTSTEEGESKAQIAASVSLESIFKNGFSGVKTLRLTWKLQTIFLSIGAIILLIAVVMLIRAKNLDFSSLMRSKITWAVIAECLILIVCLVVRPDFFSISYQPSVKMLYGSLIDILNRSAEITIISMGMTLVIALGGADLSVGALVAVAGAMALKLLRWDVTIYNTPGDYSVKPFVLVILLPLITCLCMGIFNGFLVGQLKLQAMIATLILMVGGRGIAQILTNGKQFTTLYSPFRWIGQGSFLFLPTPVVIMILVVAAVMIFVRKTAFGTFVESVGINGSASRLSGINAKKVIMIVFALTGFLSGIAGLIYSSRIMSCDSNNAGLNYETDAILAVVIGGTSMAGGKFSLSGTIIGSIIIRTIVTFVYYFGIAAEATMAFKALIIAVVIVLQSEPVRNAMAKRAQKKNTAKGGVA